MTRLRDEAVYLEPATKLDPYTEELVTDWDQAPLEHPDRIKVEPVSSSEAVLTAGTVVSRWEAWVPVVLTDGAVVDATWRIRWHGTDYEVDGLVEPWYRGPVIRFRSCILKLVAG